MEKGMRQSLKYILLIVICVVFLFPLVWALACSIKPESEILSYPPKWIPDTFTVSNYTTVLEKYPYLSWGANSLITAVCGTLMILFLSSLAAYALGRFEFRGRKLIYGTIVTMLLIPIQAYMIPLYLMCAKIGLLNTYASIIFPSAANVTSIFILTSFFKGLPRELEEAARIDGCGEFTIFLKIMLPLSKPALATLTIFTFVATWNDYLGPTIYLKSESKKTIQIGLQRFIGQYSSEYGLIMAGSVISLIPVLIMFLLLQKYFVEGIATSGVKG